MWGWYLALGVALILLGAYCIYAEVSATFASVWVIGVVLIISGVAQIVAAFMSRTAGHIILLLLIGALDIFVGLVLGRTSGVRSAGPNALSRSSLRFWRHLPVCRFALVAVPALRLGCV